MKGISLGTRLKENSRMILLITRSRGKLERVDTLGDEITGL